MLVPHIHVSIDENAAMEIVIRHLAERGIASVAYMAGKEISFESAELFAMFHTQVRAHHLNTEAEWNKFGDRSVQRGFDCAMRLFSEPLVQPEAVVCADDAIAFGVMVALHSLGLHVPQDVLVVGYNDSPIARTTMPALTSVRRRSNKSSPKRYAYSTTPRQPRAHLTRAATHRPRIHQLPALNRNFCNFAGSYRTIASQNHTAKQPFSHPLEESALGKQYVPTPLALAGDEGAEESFKDQYGIAIAGQAATRNGNILQPPHRSPTRKPHRQFGDRRTILQIDQPHRILGIVLQHSHITVYTGDRVQRTVKHITCKSRGLTLQLVFFGDRIVCATQLRRNTILRPKPIDSAKISFRLCRFDLHLRFGLRLRIVDKIAGKQHRIRRATQSKHAHNQLVAVRHHLLILRIQARDADMPFRKTCGTHRDFRLESAILLQKCSHRLRGGHGKIDDASGASESSATRPAHSAHTRAKSYARSAPQSP